MNRIIEVDDWSDSETWEMTGRNHEESKMTDEQIDELYDEYIPIYNTAYRLVDKPDGKTISLIHERTNLTVVYNLNDEAHYLALTACGSDFSQDIALAYLMIEGSVSYEIACIVYSTGELTVHGEDFVRIMKACAESCGFAADGASRRRKEFEKAASSRKKL